MIPPVCNCHWQHLDDPEQLPRYEELARIAANVLKGPFNITTDIGCGNGRLGFFLGPTFYVGIEPDAEAFEEALKGYHSQVWAEFRRENADLPGWIPPASDLFILNESLYYFRHPTRLLDKLATQNVPILVSIWQKPESRWDAIKRLLLRRPPSNLSCSRIVLQWARKRLWRVSVDKLIPNSSHPWRILLLTPSN